MKPLTKTQTTILNLASERLDGNIEPLPSNVNAGIKQRVIDGLLHRKLVEKHDDFYTISNVGLEAIGLTPQEEKTELRQAIHALATPREGTKLAMIVAMLKQEAGATLMELQDATQWQQHTVRGTLATIKKRFGFIIESVKDDEGCRRYLIVKQELRQPD